MQRMTGKVALITGAASGIGEACAVRLAAEGAHVIVTDRDGAGAAAVAAKLGAGHRARRLDVTDGAGWAETIAEIGRIEERLDVVVHSAGIGRLGDIEGGSVEDLRLQYAVNVEGVFVGSQAAFPLLKATRGAIVILSSVAGIVADPGLAGYCASKGAARMLSKAIALHGAKVGVRCNSVHPSFIDTPMVAGMVTEMGGDAARGRLEKASPLGRLGKAEEVAAMVGYLASDEAGFVSGGEFVIDGGLTAR
jgi:3(or 17)beta-hydroxysteroid dehydrogenase